MKKNPKLSVLDLCPLLSGLSPYESLKKAGDLAKATEEMGYERFWVAEHHNMGGIGSSSPEVLIPYLASQTTRLRIGSGGFMLPNHSTLHLAEIARTLEGLFPGRIDIGLGRAPGSGSKAAHAIRGSRGLSADDFPKDFDNLINWLNDHPPAAHAGVEAIPQGVEMPEVWVLGSSDFGAMFAADRGFPYAFAHHFSHMPALEVIRMYHQNFRPSPYHEKPKVIMACHLICADTDEEARELALSSDLSFSVFVQSGKSIPLPSIQEVHSYGYSDKEWQQIRRSGMPKFVGSPDTLKEKMKVFLESNLIDEIMVLSMIHDQNKRAKSYQLIKDSFSIQ